LSGNPIVEAGEDVNVGGADQIQWLDAVRTLYEQFERLEREHVCKVHDACLHFLTQLPGSYP
jgi:hypothetical protein